MQHIKNNMNTFVLTNKSDGKNHQPQIYATIIDPNTNHSEKIKVLADTGSAITCGNANLELFENMKRAQRTSNPVSANGQKLGYVGETIVNLKIGEMLVENVRVALLKDISHTLILGNNLLMQLGIKIEKGGAKMEIGSEKNIPVMGVNGVLQNNQMCGMIGNEDLVLNSLNDVVIESRDPWTWQTDHLRSISSQSENFDDNQYTVRQHFIGEKQETRPAHLTKIKQIQER